MDKTQIKFWQTEIPDEIDGGDLALRSSSSNLVESRPGHFEARLGKLSRVLSLLHLFPAQETVWVRPLQEDCMFRELHVVKKAFVRHFVFMFFR